MHILIIGAGGMIGRKLAATLARSGALGERKIERMTLVDVIDPPVPDGIRTVDAFSADLSSSGVAEDLAARRADVIFHLAAIVSGEAERDFEKGYRINLDAPASSSPRRSRSMERRCRTRSRTTTSSRR